VGIEETTDAIPAGRAWIGMDWMPMRKILAPMVGVGLANDIGRLFLLIVGLEVRALRIPYERFTVEYRQGQVVSVAQDDLASWEPSVGARLGIEVPLGSP
jgi:hypothetical protein